MLNRNKPFSVQQDLGDFRPATDKEKEYLVQMRPSTTFFRDGLKRFKKNKVAMVSFFIIVIITVGCIVIPFFWPYAYDTQLGVTPGKPVDPSFKNLKPFEYGKTELKRIEAGEKVFPHVFGTDSAGRDYFIRIVYGTRISLAVGFFASIIVLLIGLTVGSISGYFGGKVDLVIMRIVDIIYCQICLWSFCWLLSSESHFQRLWKALSLRRLEVTSSHSSLSSVSCTGYLCPAR